MIKRGGDDDFATAFIRTSAGGIRRAIEPGSGLPDSFGPLNVGRGVLKLSGGDAAGGGGFCWRWRTKATSVQCTISS